MANKSVRTHLLVKSAIALSVAIAPAVIATPASAASVAWNNTYTTDQTGNTIQAAANGDNLVLNTGSVFTAAANLANSGNFTGLTSTINETTATNGLVATGDNRAISVTGTGTLTSLTVTKGTVSSSGTIANNNATIYLGGGAATTTITNSANGSITNGATAGQTIATAGTSIQTLTVNNAGTITSNNDAGSIAFNVGGAAGSSLTLSNTNLVNAGTNGTAVSVQAGNSATITNTSTIVGAITANTTAALTLNENNGSSLQGNVTGGTGVVTVTTAGNGAITGNVNLGTNAGSSASLGGTSLITGNVGLGNSSQTLTLNGGTVTGNIFASTQSSNQGGKVVVAANTASNGAIGNTNALTSVTINDGVTLDTSTHNNSINSTSVVLGSTTGVNAKLKVGTGTVSGPITAKVAGQGIVEFAGTQTVANNVGAVGTALAEVDVDNTATLTNNGQTIVANAFKIGNGATGTYTQTGGLLASNGISISTNGTFNYNGGALSSGSPIDGAGAGQGALELTGVTLNSGLNATGANNGLASITVNNGAVFDVNSAAVKSTTTTVNNGGTVTFLSTGDTVTGALAATGTGIVNLGAGANTVTGAISTASANNVINTTINSAANFGHLTTTAAENLVAGTQLHITVGDTAYIANNQTFNILDSNTAKVANTVAITDTSAVLSFAQVADAQDLIVKATRATYASVATNSNAGNVGNALNTIAGAGTGTILQLQNAADAAPTAAALTRVLDSATPQADNGVTQGSIAVANAPLDLIQHRLDNARNGVSGGSTGDATSDKGVWISAFGSVADQHNDGSVSGYDADTGGVIIGGDKQINATTRVGLGVDYARTNISSKLDSKSTDVDTYQINAYATKDLGSRFYADAQGAFAWNHYSSDRDVLGQDAEGSYNGQTYLARVGGGYKYNFRGLDVTPNAYLDYAHLNLDSYTEKGAGTGSLHVSNDSIDVLEPKVGVNAGYTFKTDSYKIRPELRASYGYDVIGDNQVTTSNFTGTGTTFKTEGQDVGRSTVDLGAGIDLISARHVTVSADYDFEVKNNYDSHTGFLRVRYDF